MSDQQQESDSGRSVSRRWYLGAVWLGMLAFGVINVILFFQTSTPQLSGIVAGSLYLLAIGVIAAGAYYLLKWHNIARGLLIGFALMTIISGGSCTLFTPSANYSFIGASMLYALLIVVLGLAALIELTIAPPWNR